VMVHVVRLENDANLMAQAGEYIWRCMQISVRIVCELCCS